MYGEFNNIKMQIYIETHAIICCALPKNILSSFTA